MSGGHFNYDESVLERIVEQLQIDLDVSNGKIVSEYEFDTDIVMSDRSKAATSKLITQLSTISSVLHQYDLWNSGDTCETTFLERCAEYIK